MRKGGRKRKENKVSSLSPFTLFSSLLAEEKEQERSLRGEAERKKGERGETYFSAFFLTDSKEKKKKWEASD